MRIVCLRRTEGREDMEVAFAFVELKDSSGVLWYLENVLYLFMQSNQKFS